MSASADRLLAIMARLRDPEGGCPWDLEQDLSTLRPYVIEEAYEVVEAIDSGAAGALKEELGDLLLQIVFQARLAEELGWFDFDDVAERISDKMVERHPHVFGDREVEGANEVLKNWEEIKAQERSRDRGALSGVPSALPALLKAQRTGEKAAAVGFDWQDAGGVAEKIDEEAGELRGALEAGDRAAIEHELGDLLFALTSLARHVAVDAESALQTAVRRFASRFGTVEAIAGQQGLTLSELDEAALDRLWEQAKARLHDGS